MANDVRAPVLAMVTHDSETVLERNLEGAVTAAGDLDTTLVVIDNGSRDGGPELVRSRRDGGAPIQLVELESNRGYAAGVNVAFAEAAGRDVMLLNPDVALEDAAPVRALVSHMAERPRAGVAAPRLLGPDSQVQPSARRTASLVAMLGSLPAGRTVPPLRRAHERYLSPSMTTAPVSVDWVIGAAMLIRRRAYDEVGGFDPRFFLYMEDADFCRRLYRAGWSVDYLPAVGLHHGYARASSAPGATVLSSPARRRHFTSLARYWRKHPRALVGRKR